VNYTRFSRPRHTSLYIFTYIFSILFATLSASSASSIILLHILGLGNFVRSFAASWGRIKVDCGWLRRYHFSVWRFFDTFPLLRFSSETGEDWTAWGCIALDFMHDGVNIMFSWESF
jgi:hypothetical protein